MAECITMSAPKESGCCRNGVAKVLSTTVSAPASRATSAADRMSAILSNGLVGVSIQTRPTGPRSRTASGDSAARMDSGLVTSTGSTLTP